ncbi:tannase and feruloyl esterase [Aspergillus heteromorphus CBS 117.55]|uniref:Carboxylic ester hydrolase n=1 Tax=Aspergillus heteromorphus CBS 117.55 TaxID=1448321 RepID=A0A317WHY0_9EURO|nr:tannase and feruloyl esterase [Aspergillus heteromorphus CBS 117.55]PWY84777.1 tannase and feruloyl esterase [Aspergillus heteromorphus CBS 117.55]
MQLALGTRVLPWLPLLWQSPSPPQRLPQPCANLSLPLIPDAEIVSITSREVHNYTLPQFPGQQLSFCDVNITLTHTDADEAEYNDFAHVSVWLPLNATDWNGRFQATGGGGLAAGFPSGPLQILAVSQGYVAAATDGGLTLNGTIDPQSGSWALRPDGSLNTALLDNYAHRSTHDLAVIGKILTERFYGKPPTYSYFRGCSTGGRQGYFAAALYPRDFDGISAAAPGINLPHLFGTFFWPPILMMHGVVPPQCVFEVFQKAVVEKCDPLDGAVDGLISNYLPEACQFDPAVLVGKTVDCEETKSTVTITPKHARLVHQILKGPHLSDGRKLWHGLAPGASFRGIANTVARNGSDIMTIKPFGPIVGWTKNFVFQDPTYDVFAMDFVDFDVAAILSIAKFRGILGSEDHRLFGFQRAGGKLLSWHGLADEIIPSSGTVTFRQWVEEDVGGPEVADGFYRLFLAPGVGHCGGGYGPVPTEEMEALVRWVEEGRAPDTLAAEIVDSAGEKVSRQLCRYPDALVYDGHGDVKLASSFHCGSLDG